MLNSRNIDDLRPDVAAACRYGLELCKKKGLNVLVTATVRDDEYQMWCAQNGYASRNATRPTFHSVKAGLAFDFCKNVKGQEYSDIPFFKAVADVFKGLGFFWGGDWKSFPDKPHLQWDGYKHEFTGSDILAGRYPPTLIIKEEEKDVAIMEEIRKIQGLEKVSEKDVAELLASALKNPAPSGAAVADFAAAKAAGITDGSNPGGLTTRWQAAVMAERVRR